MPSGGSAWASAWRSVASTPVAVPCPRTTVARWLLCAGNQSRRAVPTGVDTSCSSMSHSGAGDLGLVGHEGGDRPRDRRVAMADVDAAELGASRVAEAPG